MDSHLPHPPPEPSSSTDLPSPNPSTEPTPSITQNPSTKIKNQQPFSNKTKNRQPFSNKTKNQQPLSNKTKIQEPFTKKIKNLEPLIKSHSQCSSSSCASSPNLHSPVRIKRRLRVPVRAQKRQGCYGSEDIDDLALPLGMAVAAVIAQVLERKDANEEKISADHLSVICSSAVKESLSYVCRYNFDGFGRNFEKSFQSTLQTLRLVNESSQDSVSGHLKSRTRERFRDMASPSTSCKQEDSACSSECETRQLEYVGHTSNADIQPNILEDLEDRVMHQQLTLHRSRSDQQLTCVSSTTDIFNKEHNQSMISTFRKSVMEQSRSNNLKELELGLVHKRLQLEEKQLDLMTEANSLGRSKLSMSYSMASFKAAKFKTEQEDTRRAELLRQCIDCLVFGLIVVLSCLGYGIYIFSFERITDATSACIPSTDSKSWWKPQVMTSLNSGMQLAWCYTQALSRIMFAISMIIVIMYLLFQRSASSNQTMPLTFIILILGIAVGIVGKLCIDTLGGSGYHWVLHWEVLCFLHFLSIFWTNSLYKILYGPITPFEHGKKNVLSPYLIRRISYYTVMLLILPLLCGLLPFAGLEEWLDHFYSLFIASSLG